MSKAERRNLIRFWHPKASAGEPGAVEALMRVLKPKQKLGKCVFCGVTTHGRTCFMHRKRWTYMRELIA